MKALVRFILMVLAAIVSTAIMLAGVWWAIHYDEPFGVVLGVIAAYAFMWWACRER